MLQGATNSGRMQITLELTSNEFNVNLLSKLTALIGGTPSYSFTANVIVAAGVVIGASSTSSYAMDCRNLPSGCDINLVMGSSSYIVGRGGDGGAHTTASGTNGGAGGPALITDKPTRITGSGIIGGGGGGGAGGRRPFRHYEYRNVYGFEQGDNNWQCVDQLVSTSQPYGTGGAGGGGAGFPGGVPTGGNAGSSATLTTGGTGGATGGIPSLPGPNTFQCIGGFVETSPGTFEIANEYYYKPISAYGGFNGGYGGSLGNPGSANSGGAGSGGASGYAIVGFSHCTITGVTLAGQARTTG